MMTYMFPTPSALAAFLNAHTIDPTKVGSLYFDGANGRHVLVADVKPYDLGYSQNPAVYKNNVAIAPNKPKNGGSDITLYAIAPALSAGLTFNVNTGVISGTPTAAKVKTTYTITMTNAAGAATVTVDITVEP
jgi:hypothetical protein